MSIFGVDELTREVALLRERSEQLLPPLTYQLGKLSASIDSLVATWKDDGGPTFAQRALQISAIRTAAAKLKEGASAAGAVQKAAGVGKEILDAMGLTPKKEEDGG